jgi:hypothetical protein
MSTEGQHSEKGHLERLRHDSIEGLACGRVERREAPDTPFGDNESHGFVRCPFAGACA